MPLRLPTVLSKPIQIDLPISHAGAFVFWVEYDGAEQGQRIKGPEGYFNVDPVLRAKGRSSILTKDLEPLPPSKGGVIQATGERLTSTVRAPSSHGPGCHLKRWAILRTHAELTFSREGNQARPEPADR